MNDRSALALQRGEAVEDTYPTTRGAANHTEGRNTTSTLSVLERHTGTSNFPLLRPYTPKLVLALLLYLQTHLEENVPHVFHNLGWVAAGDRRLVHRTMVHPQDVLCSW
jgi:hypothetical protein